MYYQLSLLPIIMFGYRQLILLNICLIHLERFVRESKLKVHFLLDSSLKRVEFKVDEVFILVLRVLLLYQAGFNDRHLRLFKWKEAAKHSLPLFLDQQFDKAFTEYL